MVSILQFAIIFVLGLAAFIYGLDLLSQGLYKTAASYPVKFYRILFPSPLRGFLAGFLLTALWQSSSLTAVITVGFVRAGLMPFSSALGVILGANIGTTLTERLLTLQIINWGPAILALGIPSHFIAKKTYTQGATGVGLLLTGFYLFSLSLKQLNPHIWMGNYILQLEEASGSLAMIAGGGVATVILQSSSAFMAFIIAMAKEDLITLKSAVFLFLGADAGTCATSLLAAYRSSRTARYVAYSHLFFNIASIIILYPLINSFIYFIELTNETTFVQVVNAHFFYNLIGGLLFLPLVVILAPYLDKKMGYK